MGFYFRKSLSFGGLRVNFSKSGVGFSAGVKGFRIGTGPRGNYVHMGLNGLYYKKTFRNKRNGNISNTANNQPTIQNIQQENYNFEKIESADIAQLIDSSANELLEEINKKHSRFRLWIPWAILTATLTIVNSYFIFLLIFLPLFMYIDELRKTVILIYDIDKSKESKLQEFYDSFNQIFCSQLKWHIPLYASLNTQYQQKINSGAKGLVRRNKIIMNFATPRYFKTNVEVPKIPVGNKVLYFFPDRILIFQNNNVGTVSYSDLKINLSNISFIENEYVASDTKIIGKTWQYANINGGPDRRFKNNRELPIVEYTELNFSSKTGLNETILLSKPNIGGNLINSLKIINSKSA